MHHVSSDAVAQTVSQASPQQENAAAPEVSQVLTYRQEHSGDDKYVEADELTLHEESRTPHLDGDAYHALSDLRAYSGQAVHGQPIERYPRNMGSVLKAHLEDQAPTDISEDGYILEPESSYHTLLEREAQLQEMQKLRRRQYHLENLREDAEGLRLKVREARTTLRRDRAIFRDLEAANMDRLQISINNHDNEAILRGQVEFARLKDARDDLNKREDEYNALEDKLLSGEWEIRNAEANVYDYAPETSSLYQENNLADNSSQATPLSPELASVTAVSRQRPKAPYASAALPRLSSAASQLALVDHKTTEIQRILEDMRNEHEMLLNEQESRTRVHRRLDSRSRTFLSEFPDREHALLDELKLLEDDRAQLQPIVADQNAIYFRPENFVAYSADVKIREMDDLASDLHDFGTTFTDEQIDAIRSLFAAPSLDTGPLIVGFLFYSPDETLSTTDFVNEWLLQALRSSKGQLCSFVSTFRLPELFPDKPFPYVRQFLMSCWFHDGSTTDSRTSQANESIGEKPSRQTVYDSRSVIIPLQSPRAKSSQVLRSNSELSVGLPSTPWATYWSGAPPSATSVERSSRNNSRTASGSALKHAAQDAFDLSEPGLASTTDRHYSSPTEPPTLAVVADTTTSFHYRLSLRGRTRSIPPPLHGQHFTTKSLP